LNKDKIGKRAISISQYFFPSTWICQCIFHLPYRQSEGIAQGHAHGKLPSIPHYTTINRRINRLNIKVEDTVTKETKDNYVIIAIDSTAIKITNRVQWLRDKWNIRKGYLKIYIAVDIKTKKIILMSI
jgi:hypothetical protein